MSKLQPDDYTLTEAEFARLPGFGDPVIQRRADGSLTHMNPPWPERILVTRELLEAGESGMPWDADNGILDMFDGQAYGTEDAWDRSVGFWRID